MDRPARLGAWARHFDSGGLALDYNTVRKMTAVQLRDELAKFPDVTGVSAMKKEQLIDILCKKLGIEQHAHAAAAIDKTAIKQEIRTLKKAREAAMLAHDATKLSEIRHRIHKQRHLLRRAVKEAEIAAAHGKKMKQAAT
jgi:cell division protein FtsX